MGDFLYEARKWLGHRDLCETQWREPCTCRCTDPDCPGVSDCDCNLATYFKTQDT